MSIGLANLMNMQFDIKKYSKSGVLNVLGFVASVVVIYLVPLLFVKIFAFFEGTGEIGDTIGGTTAPIVGVVSITLLFITLKEQRKFNDHQLQFTAEQEKIHSIEAFEKKLYNLLDVFDRTRCEDLVLEGLKGEKVFEELVNELNYIYTLVEVAFEASKTQSFFLTFEETFCSNDAKKKEILMKWSYSLFFYGHISTQRKDYEVYKMMAHYIEMTVEDLIDEHDDIPEQPMSFRDIMSNLSSQDVVYAHNFTYNYRPAQGHKAMLGRYFRQMYHIVTLIDLADKNLFKEDQKYEYAKLLRIRMSEPEQILLYYNAMSSVGKPWRLEHVSQDKDEKDKKDKIEGMPYISRFLLIKNIPYDFPYFGIHPSDKFSNDISTWREEKGRKFYEDDRFLDYGVPEVPVIQ